jgi:hypothetical protein
VSPPSFFLYIDQGEELYVRSEKQGRRRFSEIIGAGLADSRLRTLMSLLPISSVNCRKMQRCLQFTG